MVDSCRLFCMCLCVMSVWMVVRAEELRYPSPSRDKRTIGFLLKAFGDAIGYDVQKRPSLLPLVPPAKTPVAAPAASPAAAPGGQNAMMPPKAPAQPEPPAGAPAAGAQPAAPPASAGGPPSSAPAAPPGPGAKPGPAGAGAAPPSAPSAGGPGPSAPAPATIPGPAPSAAPVTPPTPPPLLTETVQKRFNLNINWNRNVQPPNAGAPAGNAAAAAGGPASAGPAAGSGPGSSGPSAGGPGPTASAGGSGPTAPAGGPGPSGPAGGPSAPAAGPSAPASGPSAPAAGSLVPIAPPSGPTASGPSGPRPIPGGPQGRVVPAKYHQAGVIYYPGNEDYPDQQIYQNRPRDNLQNDYDFPSTVNIFWQNSPWHKKNAQPVPIADPRYLQQYVAPNGEHGYHIRRFQQNANVEHQNLDEEPDRPEENYNQAENNVENSENEREEERNEDDREDDNNYDTSKVTSTYENKPRGFLPAQHIQENSFQGGDLQPGLPLAIHGVLEDKVLVAWPAPFELAGTEIKSKRIPIDQQPQYSNHEEFKYIPESYDGYNFYTVPPPVKYEYNYDGPSDPNIEKELSKNAQVSETKVGNKYTTIHSNRNVFHH